MNVTEEEAEFKLGELVAIIDPEMDLPAETRAKLVTILLQDPRMTIRFAELESLAKDAGVSDLVQGFTLNQMLDRLIQNPWSSHFELAEVLQHEPEDVPYWNLLRIVEARFTREKGTARSRLLEVWQGLEAAHQVCQKTQTALARFLKVLSTLEPVTAQRLLQRVEGLYARRVVERTGTGTPTPASSGSELLG